MILVTIYCFKIKSLLHGKNRMAKKHKIIKTTNIYEHINNNEYYVFYFKTIQYT